MKEMGLKAGEAPETSPAARERSACASTPGEGAARRTVPPFSSGQAGRQSSSERSTVPRAAPSPAALPRRDLSHCVGEVFAQ